MNQHSVLNTRIEPFHVPTWCLANSASPPLPPPPGHSDEERAALAAQLAGHKREYAGLQAALKDAALAQRTAALRSAQARPARCASTPASGVQPTSAPRPDVVWLYACCLVPWCPCKRARKSSALAAAMPRRLSGVLRKLMRKCPPGLTPCRRSVRSC